jgi:hypothetical protein
VINPILTEIIDDHRNPAAPLQRHMKSARCGGLATLSYTTLRDTTAVSTKLMPKSLTRFSKRRGAS